MRFLVIIPVLFCCGLNAQPVYDDVQNMQVEYLFKEEFNNNTQHWKIREDYPLFSSLEMGNLKLQSFDVFVMFTKRIDFNTKADFQVECAIKVIEGDSSKVFGLSLGGDFDKKATTTQHFGIAPGIKRAEASFFKWENEIVAEASLVEAINSTGYNKFTFRKIKKKYYFFVNESLVFTLKAKGFEGSHIGFFVPDETVLYVDYINLAYLTIPKKGKDKAQ